MPLLTSVLVRGINNLSDARYCAGMGADYLTFRLDPALPGYLQPSQVQELSGWVAGVQLIGEFDTLPIPEINDLAASCGLHYVLMHRRRPPAELAQLTVPALKLIQWIPDMLAEDVEKRFRDQQSQVAGFVLAVAPPDPLTAMQRAQLTQQARTYKIWLGSGFAPAGRVRQFVEEVQPTGIVLEGGQEIKPGLRDFTEMEAIFEQLEEE
jgi:phosphoribosylanthranilate isomerase